MIRYAKSGAVASAIALSLSAAHAATTVTFEDFSLGSEGYWSGNDSGTYVGVGIYGGSEYATDLTFQGAPHAKFRNTYTSTYNCWVGFAVSNHTDTTTAGYGNQASSYTGGGAGGSSQFLVSNGATNSIRFDGLTSMAGAGASFTNTTYAALDTINGSGFSKAFTSTDWFKLTISGYNANSLTGSTELVLVQGSNILDTWQHVDFSSFGMVDELRFEMTSTDTSTIEGNTYINTPAYFAMDNFVIPEPSSLGLAALGGTLLLRRRRTANQR